MSKSIRARVELLSQVAHLKGRWVKPQLGLPDGPAFVWNSDPDRSRRLVLPERDIRYELGLDEA